MTAQTRSEISALLEHHGLTPTRHLGQNFLADPNITRKIVKLSGVGPGSNVVEVGAGTGTLTRALASTGAAVVAYEVDGRFRGLLEEVTEGLDVRLRYADVMDEDLTEVLGAGKWTMVSNLPYNVGTPVVLDALRRVGAIERFVVMMQLEVASRLVARPGSPSYGLPSVVAGIHSEAMISFTVPAQVFIPPPRVDSAVVVLNRVAAPTFSERAIEIAAAAFNQRRKMLRRSLASVLDDPAGEMERNGLDPTARAEDLSPADYLRLAA
jgi:16S rRNA (adenine1518-N6/adenine1519-N6)-dimethyltransferase